MGDIFEVLKGIGAFALLWGAFTLWREYDWRRKKFTVDLFLRSADAQSRADLALITEKFPQLLERQPGDGPTIEDSRKLLREPPRDGKSESFAVRRAIMELFNAIEPIALAYHYRLVDLRAIDAAEGAVILRRYDFFKNFIEAVTEIRGDHPWPSIPTLVEALRQKRR